MAGVVVWEWQNEFGLWRPYSPKIVSFLESHSASLSPVQLGAADSALYLYSVDVQNFVQIRSGTGTQRPVRRRVIPSSSPLAKGITWQWEGDVAGAWNDFDIDVAEYIDDCFLKNQKLIDLTNSQFHLPYVLDLSQMTQTRIHTGRVRKIQRVFTLTSYPTDPAGLSVQTGVKRQRDTSQTANIMLRRTRVASVFGGSGVSTATSVTSSFQTSAASSGTHSNIVPLFSHSLSTNATGPGVSNTNVGPSLHSNFHHSHGPLTRRRYQHALSAQSSTVPASLGSQQSSGSTAFQGTGVSYFNPQFGMAAPFGSATTGFQPGLFSNVTSQSAGPSQPPSFLFHPSGSMSRMPVPGNLNPARVFGSSTAARVGPGTSHSQATAGFSSNHIQIKEYDVIPNFTNKSSKHATANKVSADSILNFYVSVVGAPPQNEDCCICYERLAEASGHADGGPDDNVVLQLEKCSHTYHKLCLIAMYNSGPQDGSLQCPACKTIYGEKQGNCPKGTMEYHMLNSSVAGYEGHRTVQISYNIHSGTQGPEHPNPGKRYHCRGFPRVGYLPDCDKGRKVLLLLIVAWKRRLTFTIGRSTTTNEDNCVTWNEIHHKTELGSNYSGHGYPDPKYLDNVLNELAVHGITEKDLPATS